MLHSEPEYGAGATIVHVASRAIRSYKHTTQYICEVTVPSFPVIIIISHEGQLSQPKLPRALGQSVHQLIPSFPQARPTGFFGLAHPHASILTSVGRCVPSPGPTPSLVLELSLIHI